MDVNWSLLRTSGPPLKMLLYDIRDVPDGLKCFSCAKVFPHTIAKTRHYKSKPGKMVCKKIEAPKGRRELLK
jgi:hypothetical protein